MNTTNIITDYIISGVLGALTFFIPWFMIDGTILPSFLHTEIKKETIIAIAMVLLAYSFGIIFNQIADYLEDQFFKLFKITVVDESEKKLKEVLEFDHHYALQFIVAKSETAYEFISFRRTMIRIVRTILCMVIFIPLLHLTYSIIFRVSGHHLIFSLNNFYIILICLIFVFISSKILKKLYKGYYSAITNFALILK
jgi:hypothetical protein